MRCILILALSLIVSGSAFGQDTILPKGLRNFQLRNSFDDADKKSEPARLQFTVPGDKSSSWLLDLALGYKISKPNSNTWSVLTEFHRNTLTDKEQKNFSLGTAYFWQQRKAKCPLLLNATGKFIRDWEKVSNSLGITGNLSVLISSGGFRFNAPKYLLNDHVFYQLTPYIGLENQWVFENKTAAQEGEIFRGILNLSGTFGIGRPNKTDELLPPHKVVEFAIDHTERGAWVNGTGNGERATRLFKLGGSYYLISADDLQLSLGVKYNKGANPMQGLSQQSFWQFTTNLKF